MSEELNVVPSAWHYHLYLWWLSHSKGNRPGYMENLCHYMRVVLLWVPLLWMSKPFWGPFKPYLGLGILATVGMSLLDPIWGVTVLFGFICLVLYDLIWGILCFFHDGPGKGCWIWFFGANWFYISPWSVVLVGSLTLILFMFGPQATINAILQLLLTLGYGVVALIVLCFLILLILWVKDQLFHQEKKRISFVILAWQFVKAKKRRVCPFIILPSSTSRG